MLHKYYHRPSNTTIFTPVVLVSFRTPFCTILISWLNQIATMYTRTSHWSHSLSRWTTNDIVGELQVPPSSTKTRTTTHARSPTAAVRTPKTTKNMRRGECACGTNISAATLLKFNHQRASEIGLTVFSKPKTGDLQIFKKLRLTGLPQRSTFI
jgi:hypothetical protein